MEAGAQKNKMDTTKESQEPEKSPEPSAEIEWLKQELAHEHDMYLRSLADFDNYRRRVERDRASAGRAGKREIMLPLLEILDGFDSALSHVSEPSSGVALGLQALQRKLLGLLETQGVSPLVSVGEAFNPEFHEALGVVDSDKLKPGTVAEELQRGYLWGGEVLRPARVRVAR